MEFIIKYHMNGIFVMYCTVDCDEIRLSEMNKWH